MTADPFAGLSAGSAAAEATSAEVPFSLDDIEAYLASHATFSFDVDDEGFIEPEMERRFIKPAEKAIIPIEIDEALLVTKTMKLVYVLIDNPKDPSKPLVVTDPKAIEAAMKQGATPKIGEFETPRFEVKAYLAATVYGDKGRPYLLSVPAMPVMIAYKDADRRRKPGWIQYAGANLLKATGVVKPGMKVTEDTLPELAEKMVGQHVMAQIRYAKKVYTDPEPVVGEGGIEIKVAVDKHGSHIKLSKGADGAPRFTEAVSFRGADFKEGDTFPGDAEALVEHQGGLFIRDNGEDSVALTKMVERTVFFDNLADNVQAPPLRKITAVKGEEDTIEAEVTWDTVGLMVPINKSGYMSSGPTPVNRKVQAVAEGGELITVQWEGTFWKAVTDHDLDVTEGGELTLTPVGGDGETSLDPYGQGAQGEQYSG